MPFPKHEASLPVSERQRDPFAIKAMAPDDLVTEFKPFVGAIVTKLRKQLHIRIALEDLEGYAYEGLLEAHSRFKPDEGAVFASFAYYRIRGAILDGCRKEGWLTRERSKDLRREQALDEYFETTARTAAGSPTPGSFREAVDRVTSMVDDVATIFLLQEADFDLLEQDEPGQHRRLEQRANLQLLVEAMKILDDQEREVVTRHHMEGERMDEIATTFGHSRSWVSRINTRALEKMRDYFLHNE